MRSQDVIADEGRPYTGAECAERLNDGREVYIDGERIKDIAEHPAHRSSLHSMGTKPAPAAIWSSVRPSSRLEPVLGCSPGARPAWSGDSRTTDRRLSRPLRQGQISRGGRR